MSETTINPEAIQAGIDALKLNRTRVTPAEIDAAIVNEQYHAFEGTTITICLLTLRNGAKVLGHNYGSIDPEQQDWEIGQAEARSVALERVWELEGYLLREKLSKKESESEIPH